MLQIAMASWLGREKPARSTNSLPDSSVSLATDIGLAREENQDRVAAIRMPSFRPNGKPSMLIAVADGMGGLRDGAKCAEIALAALFSEAISGSFASTTDRLEAAVNAANRAVYQYAGGQGGSTLSAILLENEIEVIAANVGDSRIYSFSASNDSELARLTVDDSLEEAVGGYGRDLLQFIGMGPELRPHLCQITKIPDQLIVTTDGIHNVDHTLLLAIIRHSPSLRSTAERLTAIARWHGGLDNASLAVLSPQAFMATPSSNGHEFLQLWDPYGSLDIIPPPLNRLEHGKEAANPRLGGERGIVGSPDQGAEGGTGATGKENPPHSASRNAKEIARRKTQRKNARRAPKQEEKKAEDPSIEQLQILVPTPDEENQTP